MNEETKPFRTLRDRVFWIILAVAFLLRLYVISTTVYIWDEERDWLPLVQSISLNPINLPLRGDHHSAFAAYLIKLGSLLFGENIFGFRFISLLAGLLTIFVIHKFVFEWTGSVAASRWAALLLTLNEYHVSVSMLAIEKSLHLLFALLAVYCMARFLRTERSSYLYLSGVTVGCSFLCKEIAILLLPAFFIVLLLPKYRHWLRCKEPYLAGLLFLAVIGPDIYWNVIHHDGQSETQVSLVDRFSQLGIGVSVQPLLFYFRGAFRKIYDLMGWNLRDYLTYFPSMNVLMGAVLFGGTVLATFRREPRSPITTLLIIGFWIIFGFFLLMPATKPRVKDLDSAAFYWVNLTLLPSVALAAYQLSTLQRLWHRAAQVFIALATLSFLKNVLILRLGLPFLSVGYLPEFIKPTDGTMVEIQTRFNSCIVCEKEPKVELLDIEKEDNSGKKKTSAISLGFVEGATIGTDDRVFSLRTTKDYGEWYRIKYRVTYSSGTTLILRDDPLGPVGVRVVDQPPPFWRTRVWVK